MLISDMELTATACLSLLFAAVLSSEAPAGSMVEVPEGEFFMGGAETHPPQKVFLETFFIGRHEVTNGAEDHPVGSITWHETGEYCRLTGSHLPSAPQWEQSARGTDGGVGMGMDSGKRRRITGGEVPY